jgi:hypothetical protein
MYQFYESWTPFIDKWWLIYRYFNVAVEPNIYPLASILGLLSKTCISRSTYSIWSDPSFPKSVASVSDRCWNLLDSCGIRKHRGPMPSCATLSCRPTSGTISDGYEKSSQPLGSSWHLRKHTPKLWQLANAWRLALHYKPVRLLELFALGEYLAC